MPTPRPTSGAGSKGPAFSPERQSERTPSQWEIGVWHDGAVEGVPLDLIPSRTTHRKPNPPSPKFRKGKFPSRFKLFEQWESHRNPERLAPLASRPAREVEGDELRSEAIDALGMERVQCLRLSERGAGSISIWGGRSAGCLRRMRVAPVFVARKQVEQPHIDE